MGTQSPKQGVYWKLSGSSLAALLAKKFLVNFTILYDTLHGQSDAQMIEFFKKQYDFMENSSKVRVFFYQPVLKKHILDY